MAFNVLFVCTGNTCRSPMAEGLLRASIPAARQPLYNVHSAGLAAHSGQPVSLEAAQVMACLKIDISGHTARPLDAHLVEKADLILALSSSHLNQIVARFPEAGKKTFLLSQYADKEAVLPEDIADPVGQDMNFYLDTRDQIRKYIARIAEKM